MGVGAEDSKPLSFSLSLCLLVVEDVSLKLPASAICHAFLSMPSSHDGLPPPEPLAQINFYNLPWS